MNVVTSPTAGSRRVLSRLVGVKSQSSRKAVVCSLFVCRRDATARSSFRFGQKIETNGPSQHH
jgi:hypothetical protein